MADKIFYTVLITSLLIAIIIVFFIVSVIRYHQRYIALQKQRIHAEIMIQEEERKRIANDMHDSIGPLLSTVKLYMYSINVHSHDDKELLDKAAFYIDETVNSMREISYNLLPNSLVINGLIETIREYVNRINSRQVVKIGFDATGQLIFKKENEVHIFRIIQEVIQNTLKHAQATSLQIVIKAQAEGLLLMSIDDGKGFDLDEVEKRSKGLGLKSIESRCDIIGGELQIITSKNKGCKYLIKIND